MENKAPLTDMDLRDLAHAPCPTVARARKLVKEIKKGCGASVDWMFTGNNKYSISGETLKDVTTAVSWLKEKKMVVLDVPTILDATEEGDGYVVYLTRP